MTTVLVTGATGFIAGHCIADLLAHGYAVRASVRDLRRAPVDHLRQLAAEAGRDLELVEASLDSDDGWDAACDGCDVVLHVASPNPKNAPTSEDEVIRPAVDGTLRVLRAAARSHTVRRVVLTSSSDAVTAGRPKADHTVRTEADWADAAAAAPYSRSKVLAEQAAWAFVRDTDLELVTVVPSLVLGPLQRTESRASMETVRLLLAGELPMVPPLGFAVVDVRDVATAHRLAMEVPEAAGPRYIVAGEAIWMDEIARLLAEEFGPRGYKIPTRRMPFWVMWIVARFDRRVRLALPYANRPALLSSAKAQRELGWAGRATRRTIVDAADSLLNAGVVRRPA